MPTEMKETPKQTGMCHSRVSVAIWYIECRKVPTFIVMLRAERRQGSGAMRTYAALCLRRGVRRVGARTRR